MSGVIKQTVEAIANHPKTNVAVTALITSNAWLNYGEPIIKAMTSIVGLLVLSLLLVKHALDIKAALSGDKKDDK